MERTKLAIPTTTTTTTTALRGITLAEGWRVDHGVCPDSFSVSSFAPASISSLFTASYP